MCPLTYENVILIECRRVNNGLRFAGHGWIYIACVAKQGWVWCGFMSIRPKTHIFYFFGIIFLLTRLVIEHLNEVSIH